MRLETLQSCAWWCACALAPFEWMKNNQNARPCGMPKCLPLARQNGRTGGGREPCLRMGLQTLRQAQAIGMRLLWGGRMGASGHFCAEWRIFGMEGRSGCCPCQKSLQDERIEGEGGKPLPQPCPNHGPCGAHGRDQAHKCRPGQAGAWPHPYDLGMILCKISLFLHDLSRLIWSP